MNIKIFTIAFDPVNRVFDEDPVNRFISTRKINKITPAFFETGGQACWSVFIEYDDIVQDHEKKAKEKLPDLTPQQKKLYDALIGLRRDLAEKEGVPIFIIASNRQLADIVLRLPRTMDELKSVNGFGTKKVKKYGRQILETIKPFAGEKAADESEHPPF